MQALFFHAIEMFAISMTLHIVVWRLFPLRQQLMRLGLVFLLGPALLMGSCLAISAGIDWASWALSCLLHFAAAGVYVNLYTAVVGFSPSIGILERVEASMPKGLEYGQLPPPWFTDQHLSGDRRENLLATGLICERDRKLQLTPRGRLAARALLAFRRFLAMPDIAKG
jgi:hypothetical protein